MNKVRSHTHETATAFLCAHFLLQVVPFTGDLIGTNQISFEGAAVRYYSESLEPTKDTSLKKVEDSWVEIILPFSDHLKLRNDMMLADQCSIRYGMGTIWKIFCCYQILYFAVIRYLISSLCFNRKVV